MRRHSHKTWLGLAAMTAALIAVPTSAEAKDETVLVPTSGGLGAEMPDIAARITEAINRIATKQGLKTKVTDASRDDVFAVAGCNSDDDPCHQAVLRTLGAKKLILIHVTPGTGTTTAEVEIVVATRGESEKKLIVELSSTTTTALIAELEAKAPPAFGGVATTPEAGTTGTGTTSTGTGTGTSGTGTGTGTGTDVEVPVENTTHDGGLGTGEGTPFSDPTGTPNDTGEQPQDPFAATEPAKPVAGPEDDRGGGYDFSRVGNLAWAVSGTGAGLVLTSFLFYNLAGNKQDEVNSARVNTTEDIERLKDLESSGQTLNNIGNTAFLLGVVGLGVGGYLIYRDAKVPAKDSAGVAVGPTMLGDGLGDGFGISVMVRR